MSILSAGHKVQPMALFCTERDNPHQIFGVNNGGTRVEIFHPDLRLPLLHRFHQYRAWSRVQSVGIAQGKGRLFVEHRGRFRLFSSGREDIAGQYLQHRLWALSARKRCRHALIAQGVGKLAENIKVFVILGGDAHNQISRLFFSPIHTLRAGQYFDTGFQYRIAALRRAVRDRDTVAEVSADLFFTVAHAAQISGRGMPGFG